MNKILLCLALIFSNQANAESVYDRLLNKALWSGDAQGAKEALLNGGKIGDIQYYQFPGLPEKSIRIVVQSGYNLNDPSQGCLLSEFMRKAKLDINFPGTVEFLIKNGAPVNCTDQRSAASYRGDMVLFNASADRDHGDIESDIYIKAYKYLLNKSNQVGIYQETGDRSRGERKLPIDATIHQGNKKIFKLLVDAGSPLDMSSAYMSSQYNRHEMKNIGWTPLEAAIYFNDVNLVKYILAKGADINYVNGRRTALDYAHERENDNIELFLIKLGAKYNSNSNLNR